ncbi:hypothetical protein B0919_03440 [Hymenobacter sp. CRA2]|nr:hypothetical protein B0919_03440 [Hymenobacter sp. CRA2]
MLTYTIKRLPQMPGFQQRFIRLNRQLDTLATPMQFYRLNAGLGRAAAFGGYVVCYGSPGATPADNQKLTLVRYRNDFSLAWGHRGATTSLTAGRSSAVAC